MNDNPDLDGQGFAPFARLVDKEAALPQILKCYVEPSQMDQSEAKDKGAAYFAKFPKLSYWKSAEILG